MPALTSFKFNKEEGCQPQLNELGILIELQTPLSLSGRQGKNHAMHIKHTPRRVDERLHHLEQTCLLPHHQVVPRWPLDVSLCKEQIPMHCQDTLTGPEAEYLQLSAAVVMRFNNSLRA